MAETKTYTVIAYDVKTGQVVFSWHNVPRPYRCPGVPDPLLGPSAGLKYGAFEIKPDVITDGGYDWQVVGVRKDSTPETYKIDVVRLEAEENPN
jgi:hypothetical protein